MTQYETTKPTEMETKGASPEAGEMGEKGLSSDVVIPNPLAAATASGDDAKVDLALEGTYEEIDNKDTKLWSQFFQRTLDNDFLEQCFL